MKLNLRIGENSASIAIVPDRQLARVAIGRGVAAAVGS